MVTRARRYRFSSEEYDKMAEAGIFDEDSPVELIHGEIIEMAAEGHRHAGFVSRLDGQLRRLIGERAFVWSQSTLRLGDGDHPEPDLVLLRPDPDDHTTRPPTVEDVLLIVEVAESSISHDRRAKAALYARYGIPEYWIVDVNTVPATIRVYRNPSRRSYRVAQVVRSGDTLAPLAFPDALLDTERLLR